MVKIKKSQACPKRPLKRKQQIELSNTQKDLPLSMRKIKRDVKLLLSYLKIETDLLTIHFVTKKRISLLHLRFFNDPTPTDCITLPIDSPTDSSFGYHVLGEIFVCPSIAKEYAKQHLLPVQEELMRYLIHGVLHLIGYDDMQLKDRRMMKKKEEDCLYFLGLVH